jgi:ubiquinone/menaquinone biosynthesis C-methylase UbiE
MAFSWPPGFPRVPDEDWTRAPVDSLAAKYDRVEKHGWYANLDPTVEDLGARLREGDVLLDYSGGTGILIDRLLKARPALPFGVVNVDSSPKFLALSLQKLGDEPRVAFRLLRFLKERKRLQLLDEVLERPLLDRGVDALVSANAIHLYYDLPDTLRSWHRVLRPGGHVHVQSGNIAAAGPEGRWIIDETVDAIGHAARDLVKEDPQWAAHRAVLEDAKRMAEHDALRKKFFLPARPLAFYVDALEEAGFADVRVRTRPIRARTKEWFEFLQVYHEGVLGWVGGSERVEGRAPDEAALRDRKDIMWEALRRVVQGKDEFDATWTYVTCRKP